ncbi:MAG TPA: ADP-ribosylglycohydrolase family protein, partial [Geobacteraceae bacterium]
MDKETTVRTGTRAAADLALLADRFRGALWGQFVGDAYCLGSHWIYDLSELDHRFPGGVKGFETPLDGHYHSGKRSGDFTHYGDGALLLLRSVAEQGRFDARDFGARFVALFGSDDYRGYRDHATRGTLEKYAAFVKANTGTPFRFQDGADDDQPATATRLVPVVVAHYWDNALLAVVESATRAGQNNDRAVAYMKAHAVILRELFSGAGLGEALATAVQAVGSEGAGSEAARGIEAAVAARSLDVREATLKFGQSCPLASSFPAAVHAALKYETDAARAIAETANAGGDSAGRAALIGAWLGARLGLDAIPAAWRDRLNS